MKPFLSLAFAQRWQTLPAGAWSVVSPTPLAFLSVLATNASLARDLGIDPDSLLAPEALAVLGGAATLPVPALATCYAGHQFGVYAGRLGDGRALLIGDADTARGRMEFQLKGAGMTPYSRMGDGRAVLRSSIREYLCSEAMYGLGIPTTRALYLAASPERVMRDMPETCAVVTRVAESFLRFGHLEWYWHQGDEAGLKALADFALLHHFPEEGQAGQPYLALFGTVLRRTAELMAQWQAAGFCHGVMNTDNMSLLGLTLDYGPFGFLDRYDPAHICNHSDHAGRYAFDAQPQVGLWNLYALASALQPLAPREDLVAVLETYRDVFDAAYLARMRAKLGLAGEDARDAALVTDLLQLMAASAADYTRTFRQLSHGVTQVEALSGSGWDAWCARYAARLETVPRTDAERRAAMLAVNPRVVLRNHLAELAIRAVRDEGDATLLDRLLQVLHHPFDEGDDGFDALPPDWAGDLCVSCSS